MINNAETCQTEAGVGVDERESGSFPSAERKADTPGPQAPPPGACGVHLSRDQAAGAPESFRATLECLEEMRKRLNNLRCYALDLQDDLTDPDRAAAGMLAELRPLVNLRDLVHLRMRELLRFVERGGGAPGGEQIR